MAILVSNSDYIVGNVDRGCKIFQGGTILTKDIYGSGGAESPRIFGMGVPKYGEVIFPMTPVCLPGIIMQHDSQVTSID